MRSDGSDSSNNQVLMRMVTSIAKKPLLSLSQSKGLPQHLSLSPDPTFTLPQQIVNLSKYSSEQSHDDKARPSMLRRSRPVNGHFSYVTPLPLEFPYRVPEVMVQALKDSEEHEIDIEAILKKLEPDFQSEPLFKSNDTGLCAYTSPDRQDTLSKAKLLGLSQTCLRDVLPDLDVESQEAQDQLVQVLSGRAVAIKLGETREDTLVPWSLCYAGHQFGSYAGQLGDGRAMSIMTVTAPPLASTTDYVPPMAEIQLKGAGRTPFSRFADGLAVLRSSVREYLGSEAMAALGIPTSRALSIIHLPDLEVIRESRETGAVVARVAPSWVRIGNFEMQKERKEWNKLLALAQYCSKTLFGQSDERHVVRNVLQEVAKRNAVMVAGWQAYGFMHGVMNTDNISVLGLTIDYGPFAFMDVFDFSHICNHSDDAGRYAYRFQPTMIDYAVRKLGDALAETIGAEIEAPNGLAADWAQDKTTEELQELKNKGLAFVDNVLDELKHVFKAEYMRLFQLRFGLLDSQENDQRDIVDAFLNLLNTYELDFFHSFRTLCLFPGTDSDSYDAFLDRMLPVERVPEYQKESSRPTFKVWLERYEKRLKSHDVTASESHEQRKKRMQAVNPRFSLRQWILEEAIKRLEEDGDTAFLERVLHMSVNPFDSYGELALDEKEDALACRDKETEESVRLCQVGSSSMLGFQCSCSS